MKITICGSIAFFEGMLETKAALESLGHEVKIPPTEIEDENGNLIPVQQYYARRKAETSDTSWIWDRKAEAMHAHFEKVEWGDAVLVLNYDKNGIPGYVGANTLLEMGLAFHLGKPIYLLNAIPELSYKEEILGMKPTCVSGDLSTLPR
jgi:hypothetical protein